MEIIWGNCVPPILDLAVIALLRSEDKTKRQEKISKENVKNVLWKVCPRFFLPKILPILIHVRLDLQSVKHKDQKKSEKIEKVKAPKKGSAPQLKALKTSCMHFWSLVPDFACLWVSRLFKEKPKKQETKVNQEVSIETGWWNPIAARLNTPICIGIEILGRLLVPILAISVVPILPLTI